MPSSTYHLRFEEGIVLYKKMKDWLDSHPKGTKILVKSGQADLGSIRRPLGTVPHPVRWLREDVEVEVTGTSRCDPGFDRGEAGEYIGRCEIELRDTKYGGLANVQMNCSIGEECKLEMIDADFPYPAEFDFAKQELGLDFSQRMSWCVDLEGLRHCSAQEVIGGGFSHQGLPDINVDFGEWPPGPRPVGGQLYPSRAQRGDIVGRGSSRNRQLLGQSISDRVNNSYDVLGHPQSREKPVEERTHYTVLAYSDWADQLIPTIVQWNHGEVDDFTDLDKSRENQKKALYPNLQPTGPWSYPDIWEKAKEKYPDSPMDAWRYYWEESKKRLAE